MKMRSLKSGCLSVVLLLVLLLSCGCTQHTPPADVSSLPHNDISRVVSAISEVPVTSVPSAEEKSEVSDTAAVSEISVPSQETHDVSESLPSEPSEASEISAITEPVSSEESIDHPSSSHPDPSAFASEPAPESSLEDNSQPSEEVSPAPVDETSLIKGLRKKYFVNRLDTPSLQNFARLYKGALDCTERVTFSYEIPSAQLDTLMFLLNYDCPELIHLSGDYIPIYSDTYGDYVSGVGLIYYMSPDEYHQGMETLSQFQQQLSEQTAGMSPRETEQYVYDLLFNTVVFDDYSAHSGSIYGALIEHRARCEGISKAFAWCLQHCGMECMTVAGTPLWENTGAYAGHSWNIVRLDNDYYYVDVAADNLRSYPEESVVPLYGFLNSSEAQMQRTHLMNDIFRNLGVPPCFSDQMNYHVAAGQYISSDDDMQECFERILYNRYVSGEYMQISIRLDTEISYQNFIDNWESWLEQFCQKEGYVSCGNTVYYNDVSLTVVIVINPQ